MFIGLIPLKVQPYVCYSGPTAFGKENSSLPLLLGQRLFHMYKLLHVVLLGLCTLSFANRTHMCVYVYWPEVCTRYARRFYDLRNVNWLITDHISKVTQVVISVINRNRFTNRLGTRSEPNCGGCW